MSSAKLKMIKISFEEYLRNYEECFNQICMQLLDICSSKKDHHQQKIWMEPYPPNTTLTKQHEQQLKEIIHHTSKINSPNGFRTFHRNFI